MHLDHAVFTSLRTSRLDGYQLADATAGVTSSEARELSQWGPAHDSLMESAMIAGSVNFHALSSGRHCISRTIAAEAEYSGRGGARIETQCYLASAEDYYRFSNNPFRVLEAATAIGGWQPHSTSAKPTPLRFAGRAAPVDRTLIAELIRDPGPAALCTLLDAVLKHEAIGVVWKGSLARAFAGLVNLLPVSARPDLTFSTGLRYSARRPYRLIGLPEDITARRRVEKAANLKVIDWNEPPKSTTKLGGWASVVRESLVNNRLIDLGRLIDPRYASRTPTDLAEVAELEEAFCSP
jgi:hypothetical protein